MGRQFFSGNTVEQAILAAAHHFDLDPSRIAYKLRDKKHGFLNARRRAVIEVDPDSPEQSAEAEAVAAPTPAAPMPATAPTPAAPTPAAPMPAAPMPAAPMPATATVQRSPTARWDSDPGTPRRDSYRTSESWSGEKSTWTGEDAADLEIAAFEQALEEVLDLLDLDVDGTVRRAEEGFDIELTGPDSDELARDQGKALRSIEHLLPRMVRGLIGYGLPCRVDSDGFRAAHEEELRQLAEEVAAEVRSTQEEQCLEPLNPFDRRLVHLALADDPTVRTESMGEGFLKRVSVIPE